VALYIKKYVPGGVLGGTSIIPEEFIVAPVNPPLFNRINEK
jgi:hypothetical protein